jgi:hypothetical protein
MIGFCSMVSMSLVGGAVLGFRRWWLVKCLLVRKSFGDDYFLTRWGKTSIVLLLQVTMLDLSSKSGFKGGSPESPFCFLDCYFVLGEGNERVGG